MKYDLRPEFAPLSFFKTPMNRPILAAAYVLMPVIQKGKRLYPGKLIHQKIDFSAFTADLYVPEGMTPDTVLLYCHGGAFAMRPAAYHKNLVQRYAMEAGCIVLAPDYRVLPSHPYPASLKDCLSAYQWLVKEFSPARVLVGGDSAGGTLTAGIVMALKKKRLRMPDAAMLVYPALDARMETESMKIYTDTPMWNSRLNRKMWPWYLNGRDYIPTLASPALASDISYFPPTYVETAQFDCLHDEGIDFARRLAEEGVPVMVNETQRTMHGYDIVESSPYVKEQVARRIAFLKEAGR